MDKIQSLGQYRAVAANASVRAAKVYKKRDFFVTLHYRKHMFPTAIRGRWREV